MMSYADADMYRYLWSRGFDTPGDWALEAGYKYNKRDDIWYDDEGQAVNIEDKIFHEMEPKE